MNKKYTVLAAAMLVGMSCTSSYAAKDLLLQNQSNITMGMKVWYKGGWIHGLTEVNVVLAPGKNKKFRPLTGRKLYFIWWHNRTKEEMAKERRLQMANVQRSIDLLKERLKHKEELATRDALRVKIEDLERQLKKETFKLRGRVQYTAGPFDNPSSFVFWAGGKYRVKVYRPKFLQPKRTVILQDGTAKGVIDF